MEIKDVLEMGRRLRNWGRWGPEDELGTLNFITPEKIVEACRLVKRGKAFALAHQRNSPSMTALRAKR